MYLTSFLNQLRPFSQLPFYPIVLHADDLEETSGHAGVLGSVWYVSLSNTHPLLLSQTKSTVVLLNPSFTSGAVWAPQELVGVVLLFDLGGSRVVWPVEGQVRRAVTSLM